MPVRSMHGCSTPGCGGLTRDKFCIRCKGAGAKEDNRPSAAERGYDYKWQQYRADYLRVNRECFDPFDRHPGLVVPSTVVDHIKAHKGNKELFWDPNNHQALCLSCNSYKAAMLEGGFGHSAQAIENKQHG